MRARVSSYMSAPVRAVRPEDTLARARNLMLRDNVSRLVVVGDDGMLAGIITITDVADALVNRFPSRPAEAIPVGQVMTKNPVVVEPSRSVRTAANLMLKYGVGGLPVVNAGGRVVGIITKTDVVRAFHERCRGMYTVSSLMRRSYSKARRDHSVFYILKLIELDATGKVLIFDGDELVGIVAKRDLAFIAAPVKKGRTRSFVKIRKSLYKGRVSPLRIYSVPLAEDIMTHDPITVDEAQDAAKAAGIMVSERIGALPVVDEKGRVRGLFSKIEVLTAIASMNAAPKHEGG